MGCDQAFPTPKDVKFAPTQATEKMKNYYSDAERSLVEDLFAEDIELFRAVSSAGLSLGKEI